MDAHARWEAHLFEPHSREELARWAPTLRFFRYCRAVGGHSGSDADELRVALRVETRAELDRVLSALGTRATPLAPDEPEPEIGRSYTGYEWQAFRQRMRGFPDLEQPGHIDLAGTRAFAWVGAERLTLTVGDPDRPYEVTDRAVAAARWVEPLLGPVADAVIDPPLDDPHCICPQRYPELWAS